MEAQERQIIDELFGKLKHVEGQSGARDGDAERHIRSRVEAQPAAPYYMAQTILVQEQALANAQARIQELEGELARQPQGGGGFLSSLFGGGSQPQRPAPAPMAQPGGPGMAGGPSGFGAPSTMAQPGRGGGFLAGAASTAMGVAGGMMLGSMLGSAFGGGSAQAAPQTAAAEPEPADDFGGGMDDDFI
ncbi:DUF2076 domain-containing protein [Enterovirga sp. CN4-39]|uniref:DUF2076 domain-containing protein n=1 Tax=Enterovirga sp. CN4-39 TaxID=3400910 RepID=UPI003C0C4C7A